jgi:hypothetical protein
VLTYGFLRDALNALQHDGVAIAPWTMEYADLFEMLVFLDECDVWPAHVAGKASQHPPKKLKAARMDGEWPAFAPTMDDVVRAPHFLEYALRCYPIAKEYFGEPPVLYSVNVFWTQPAATQYGETHTWHRDGDDRKQLGMFLFGTDVSEDSAHLYQRGTHRLPNGEAPASASLSGDLHPHAELIAAQGGDNHNPDPANVIKVFGPAGTIFLEDPNGVHMGMRPSKPRCFAWARFGVSSPSASYKWDNLRPASKELIGDRFPSDPELQAAIRFVVS